MAKFVGLITKEPQDNAETPKKERKKKTGANKSASKSNKAENAGTAPVAPENTEVDHVKTEVDPDTEIDKVEVEDNECEAQENTDNEGEPQDNAETPKKERK